jgi:hypothetical protein
MPIIIYTYILNKPPACKRVLVGSLVSLVMIPSEAFFSPKGTEKYIHSRVARCYFFKPKSSIWENFGGPWNGKG